MMMHQIVFIWMFFALLLGISQDISVTKLNGKPDFLTTDEFDQVYIRQAGVLYKFNQTGKLVGSFSRFDFGALYSIDASDPLQIVLFYKDFNTILVLDKQLNPVGNPIKLDDYGFSSVEAVCKSKHSGVWLFDSFEQKLSLFSLNSLNLVRQIDLLKHSKPIHSIDYLFENGNTVYLQQSMNAVFAISDLGGKLEVLKIQSDEPVQFRGNNLYFYSKDKLFRYRKDESSIDTLNFESVKKFDHIRVGSNRLIYSRNDSLFIASGNLLN